MSGDRRQFDDERLDELLAQARWPEPSRESTQRVLRRWQAVRPRRRLRLWAPLAAAAAVVIAAGVAMVVMREQPVEPVHLVEAPESDQPVAAAAPISRYAVPSRPITPIEEVLLAHAIRREQAARHSPAIPDEVRIARAIEQLAAGEAEVSQVAAELRTIPAAQAHLLRHIGSTRDERQPAAASVFALMAGPAHLPLLLEMARRPELREVVVPGVIRVADSQTLLRLAREEQNRSLQEELLVALLSREGANAVPVFLELMIEPETSAAAMQVIENGASEVVVQELFLQLNHPRADLRLTAARALGRINGPQVTARLAEMIQHDINRREALAALLFARSPAAAALRDSFRRHPLLASEMYSVQVQMESLLKGAQT